MAFNYSECNVNIQNIDYLIEKREYEEKLLYEKENSESYNKYQEAISDLNKKIRSSSGSADGLAIRIGEKYNVTDKELENIAKVCQQEQGRPTGAAAEAELMVNKYVLSGYTGTLYQYLFSYYFYKHNFVLNCSFLFHQIYFFFRLILLYSYYLYILLIADFLFLIPCYYYGILIIDFYNY